MARLDVYDKFGAHLESHKLDVPLTDWLTENVPAYTESISPPYSATLNYNEWPHERHSDTLSRDDSIAITIEPQEPATIAYIAIVLIAAAYAYSVAQNIPKYEATAQSGASIYSPGANANSISPSGMIREIAGQMPIIYPDYICPVHRRYENNDEFLYINLGICGGYIDAQKENIYIAETAISNYAGDITAVVSEPGADISAIQAHENWYQSKEVSNLTLTTVGEVADGDWYFDALGAQFTSYIKATGAASPAVEPFPFIVGERFEIAGGSNPGYYEVSAISGTSNEIADVIGLARVGGDTGRLEVLTKQSFRFGSSGDLKTITRNIFSSSGTPLLVTTSQESASIDSIAGGVNWEGAFLGIPENETTESAEIDVRFSSGLVELDSNNEEGNRTVELILQWRDYGNSDWETVSGTTFTAATYDDLGYTIAVDFGSAIRPEFRFRRVTIDADSVNISDIVKIERIKCRLAAPSSYPDITTLQIKVRGTNALASTAENRVNVRNATRKLPTIDQVRAAAAGTPFDLSTSITTTNTLYDLSAAELQSVTDLGYGKPASSSIDINQDGLHMIVMDGDLNRVRFYDLETANDPSSLIYIGYIDVNLSVIVQSAKYADSGNKIVVTYRDFDGVTTYPVVVYNLNTPYAPDFASTDAEYLPVVAATETAFSNDGFLFYVLTSDAIYQYPLSSAFDLSTIGASSSSYSHSDGISAFCFSDSGSKIYIAGSASVTQAEFSTAFDLSTIENIEQFTSSTSYRSLSVFSGGVIYTGTSTYNFSVALSTMAEFSDSAATRSIMRFVVSSLYDALGADAETMVDWDAVSSLETLLDARGDTLDAEFIDETTLWDAIKIMLGAGYAEPTLKEGRLLPVRIASGTDYTHLYTPDVMLGEGLHVDNSFYDSQEPDGVDVEYLDETTGEMEVVECRATGDAGLRPSSLQVLGITNATKAWRYGMRERNRLRYKPANYTFTTEMDALNSSYGEPTAIASELFVSQCGEIVDYSAPNVTLDFEPEFGTGTHYAAFRNREGEMSGLYEVTAGASPEIIVLSSPALLDFVPVLDGSMDSTFMSFGDSDEWGKRAIIRSIRPSGENEVEVTAEEYVAAVYADDNNEPS